MQADTCPGNYRVWQPVTRRRLRCGSLIHHALWKVPQKGFCPPLLNEEGRAGLWGRIRTGGHRTGGQVLLSDNCPGRHRVWQPVTRRRLRCGSQIRHALWRVPPQKGSWSPLLNKEGRAGLWGLTMQRSAFGAHGWDGELRCARPHYGSCSSFKAVIAGQRPLLPVERERKPNSEETVRPHLLLLSNTVRQRLSTSAESL